MNDLRSTKTKAAIYAAFGKLLKQKSMDQISITEIVTEANITRRSFYNHYQDKYDFVEKYQEELSTEILAIAKSYSQKNYAFFHAIFVFLSNQGEILEGLLSLNGSLEVQELIKGLMKKYCLVSIQSINKTVMSPIEENYLTTFLANAIFGVIQLWLTTGKRTPPEEMAAILTKIIPNKLFSSKTDFQD